LTQTSSPASRKPKPPNYEPYVRHAVSAEAGPQQAFEVLLQDFPAWWPHNFRCTKSAPRQRRRLVIAWHLNGFGRIDPDNASEFEVRFTPDGATRTRVEVETPSSTGWAPGTRSGFRNGMDKGRPTILAAYTAKIAEHGDTKH
jgi:hypothetical protein